MPRDAQHTIDGDTRFIGIAPRLDPASLPEGIASEGENVRFRNGVAESRRGMYKPPWINNITPEIDNKIRPFTTVHGVGVFRNPDTNLEFIIIAADNKVYYTRQNNNPISMGLPGNPPSTRLDGGIDDLVTTITVDSTAGYPASGVLEIDSEKIHYTTISGNDFTGCTREYDSTTADDHVDNIAVSLFGGGVSITGTVNFVQAFNKLMMFRGDDFAPLVLTSEDIGFEDMISQWDLEAAYAVEDQVAFGPLVALTSIAHSGGTATVTTSVAHGYVTGADVTIAGAGESAFNGRFNITVTADAEFTYTGGTGSSATGTITATNNEDYYECTVITSAGESPSTTTASWSQLSTIMPNATHAVHIANRIVAPTKFDASATSYLKKRDFVTCSDLLDHSHTFFDQVFRVNAGDNDEIEDILVFDENRLLVLKGKSVHMITAWLVTGTNSTLSASISVQPIIQTYGVPGRGAAVVVGGNVYFYASNRGVVSLAQTAQSKVRGVDLPLSEPIQPLIDRIDPRHEDNIRLAYWDNRLWLACGIDDGSDGNNAILTYSFLNSQWESYDFGTAINPAEWFTATYDGAQRLFYVGVDGYINLVEENWVGDDIQDLEEEDGLATTDFTMKLVTRGYKTQDIHHRAFRTASINIATWNPKYTIRTLTDGVNEAQTLVEDRTKNRALYYRPFDATPFETNNTNDDHDTAYRQDYSVALTETTGELLAEDGSGLMSEGSDLIHREMAGFEAGPTANIVLGSAGINFSRMQETSESFALNPRQGRFMQLETTVSQGRASISQVTLTSQPGDRTTTVKS